MLEVFNIPQFIHTYGYIGIFLVVFLESGVFPPLPGDSLLFTAGLFAGAAGFNIILLLISIFIATFLGSILGYHVGVHLIKLHKYSLFRKLLKQENVDKAHKFFERYGKVAITFCRFVPFMRTFTPIVAGVAKMNYFSFLRYNAIGAALWTSILTLLGYFLGRTFPTVKDYLFMIVILFVVISLVPIFLEYLRQKRNAKRVENQP
jgi:membrane-associated protein